MHFERERDREREGREKEKNQWLQFSRHKNVWLHVHVYCVSEAITAVRIITIFINSPIGEQFDVGRQSVKGFLSLQQVLLYT